MKKIIKNILAFNYWLNHNLRPISLILSGLGFFFAPHSGFAQIPQPDIIGSYNGGSYIEMRWLHVADSVRYAIDVAYDSTFTQFLPGLRNFTGGGLGLCVDNPISLELLDYITYSQRVGRELSMQIFDITHNTTVYARIQAIHVSGARSNYSKTVKLSHTDSIPTFLDMRVVRTGRTSAYIPSSQMEAGKQYIVRRLPVYFFSSLAENLLASIIPWCQYYVYDNYSTTFGTSEEIKRSVTKNDTAFTVPYPDEWSVIVMREQGSSSVKYYSSFDSSLKKKVLEKTRKKRDLSGFYHESSERKSLCFFRFALRFLMPCALSLRALHHIGLFAGFLSA